MSTLDHLTNGPHRLEHRHRLSGQRRRAAWGSREQAGHDTATRSPKNTCRPSTSCGRRAGRTAPCCATARGAIFADADKIHRIDHDGPYFQIDAIHLCEPSPQRTPVLYQAGASTRGRAVRRAARRMRLHQRPVEAGRSRRSSPTSAAAPPRRPRPGGNRDLHDDDRHHRPRPPRPRERSSTTIRRYVSEEGALALMSGWTGVDFSRMPARRAELRFAEHGCDDLGAGGLHHRRPGPRMDGAGNRPPRRDRRARAGGCRLARTRSPTS